MPRVHLTPGFVKTATSNGRERELFWDAELHGFGLMVTERGHRSWIYQYRNRQGSTRRITIKGAEDADKLLHLTVEIGEQAPRSIVAGIAEAYPAEQLIGRKVVIVANLQPRKLRGLESNGMIVAASIEGGKPVLAGFLEDVPVGARLK